MINDVSVKSLRLQEILDEIVPDHIQIIWAHDPMVLARKHHHVETLPGLDQGIRKPVCAGWRHIIVNVASDQQQTAAKPVSQFHSRWNIH